VSAHQNDQEPNNADGPGHHWVSITGVGSTWPRVRRIGRYWVLANDTRRIGRYKGFGEYRCSSAHFSAIETRIPSRYKHVGFESTV
jgi:hypothetical protein